MNKLQKLAPSLKVVADDVAATKLRELLKDADDGFRRVVKAGLYIEWIAANLPHGQFLHWLDAHASDVPQRVVYRWRTMAKNLCEWSGLKFANLANLTVPAENLLTLPVTDLPKNMQAARTKMDEVLDSARTPKQLFLDIGFKQGELGADGYPRAKRGNKSGKGCTKAMRMQAKYANDQERLIAMEINAGIFITWVKENLTLNGFPRMDEAPGGKKTLLAFKAAIKEAHLFFVNLERPQ